LFKELLIRRKKTKKPLRRGLKTSRHINKEKLSGRNLKLKEKTSLV